MTPSLDGFRRIVVKIGSSLLVDERGLKTDWLDALAADLAGARRRPARPARRLLGRHRARPAGPRSAAGPLKLEESQAAAAVGQIALARAYSETLAAPRLHRRPDPAHPRRYRGAAALPQRPLDHRDAAQARRDPGHQRERHGRHQRDPLRRQRSPRRAGRHHDGRRPPHPALRRRRPLFGAAGRRPGRPPSCRWSNG